MKYDMDDLFNILNQFCLFLLLLSSGSICINLFFCSILLFNQKARQKGKVDRKRNFENLNKTARDTETMNNAGPTKELRWSGMVNSNLHLVYQEPFSCHPFWDTKALLVSKKNKAELYQHDDFSLKQANNLRTAHDLKNVLA